MAANFENNTLENETKNNTTTADSVSSVNNSTQLLDSEPVLSDSAPEPVQVSAPMSNPASSEVIIEEEKSSKAFNIFSSVFLIFGLICLVIAALTVILNINKPDDAYIFGKYKPILVMSGSMDGDGNDSTPAHYMKVGSIVIAEKTSYDKVKVGDVITFSADNQYVTHRVAEITEKGIITKGDANSVSDGNVLGPESIKAKVISVWNWAAPITIFFMSSNWWIYVSIAVIILIIFILFLRSSSKSRKMQKQLQSMLDKQNNN